ncbi:hypothetical protein AA106556_0952 [Neokomagataea tanensis NBRC 106556]|uniref:Uncharacterized protein n=1 Tax=Neokomagataea tanensis NBRC 106556 TaxID=1223519 RepID=A0ABQ0QIM8_9PROT|nr:hypothetical protein AA106556_0952 [Neokomagataea tanensis NBRC 106556]
MKTHYNDLKESDLRPASQRCCPGNRLCLRIDIDAGAFGETGNIRIIKGYRNMEKAVQNN